MSRSLDRAKNAKQDEFYTQLSDIENELKHYRHHFIGKTILCNCDDPYESNFFKYFAGNFNFLGIKKLIATCYNGSPVQGLELSLFEADSESRKAFKVEITEVKDLNGDGRIDLSDVRFLIQNDKNVLTELEENGDFRSDECIELLKEADIVVTNPPFSLFREYVDQLMKYNKKFLIIGNQNAITYKEIFPLIKNNLLWLGYKFGDMAFKVPDYYEPRETRYWQDESGQKWRSMGNICWFTNLDHKKRHEELILYKKYTPEEYPKYDNYDAINVDKVSDIPCDYYGVMGVPITFLDKYNPEQFEIVEFRKGNDGKDLVYSIIEQNRTEQNRTEQNRTEQNRTEQNRTEQLFSHTSEYSSVDASRRINEQSEGYSCEREKQVCKNTRAQYGLSSTAIPGLIKNAEGKIAGRITYARMTIRRISK